jgi:hypothetical protein
MMDLFQSDTLLSYGVVIINAGDTEYVEPIINILHALSPFLWWSKSSICIILSAIALLHALSSGGPRMFVGAGLAEAAHRLALQRWSPLGYRGFVSKLLFASICIPRAKQLDLCCF